MWKKISFEQNLLSTATSLDLYFNPRQIHEMLFSEDNLY